MRAPDECVGVSAFVGGGRLLGDAQVRAAWGFSPGGVEESLMSMTNTVLVPDVVDRGFDPFRARVAVGGFLAGYTGQTFNAYALDLRQ